MQSSMIHSNNFKNLKNWGEFLTPRLSKLPLTKPSIKHKLEKPSALSKIP